MSGKIKEGLSRDAAARIAEHLSALLNDDETPAYIHNAIVDGIADFEQASTDSENLHSARYLTNVLSGNHPAKTSDYEVQEKAIETERIAKLCRILRKQSPNIVH